MSGITPTKKVRLKREAKLVHNVAEMKAGVYAWPDGKEHIDKDGVFEVSWQEAFRNAGYNVQSVRTLQRLKNSPEILDRIALEETRLKEKTLVLASDITNDAQRIRKAAAAELMSRLEAQPDAFKVRDLVRLYVAMESLERRQRANEGPHTGDGGTTTINVNNITLGLQNNLPPEQFAEFLDSAVEEKQAQLEQIQRVQMAARAKADEANEEIIDGEAF